MIPRVSLFEGKPAEWDSFAESQQGYCHFHRLGWRTVIEQVFGHRCLYLAARGPGDSLHGILPLVRIQSRLFGRYLVSVPFLNYGGPLGTSEAVAQLAGRAVEEAKASRARLLELRCRASLPLELPASHRKITVVLDLPASADTLFQSFPSKLRSQIRRPEREGITVRFGLDQLDPFFRVFSHHMRDLGTPTLPRRFFRAIAQQFPEDVWFGCAWLGNEPVACGAGFRWGTEFELTWASSLSAWNRIAPNMLLYWSFLERSIALGVTLFNFGRCTPDSGTHRFKRQWGSRDVPLWWYQWTPHGQGEAATPSPDQRKYAWGPRLWRHLPLGLSRVLGPWIVKSIP